MFDKIPTWAVTDAFGEKVLARPVVANGQPMVHIRLEDALTRKQWESFRDQVDELMDIAESDD